jgi:hypothetical protein
MFPALEDAVLRSTAALAVDVDVDVAEGEAEAEGELPAAAGLVAAGVVPPPPAHPVSAAVRARMARPAPICFFMGCSFAGARRRSPNANQYDARG